MQLVAVIWLIGLVLAILFVASTSVKYNKEDDE